jgi:hypothetical protein
MNSLQIKINDPIFIKRSSGNVLYNRDNLSNQQIRTKKQRTRIPYFVLTSQLSQSRSNVHTSILDHYFLDSESCCRHLSRMMADYLRAPK